MNNQLKYFRKKLFLAIFLTFIISEASAIERCPEPIRYSDMEMIANIEDKGTFQWKGESWTKVTGSGRLDKWRQLIKEGVKLQTYLHRHYIELDKGIEKLRCEYRLYKIGIPNEGYLHLNVVGSQDVETIVKD